MPTENVGRGVTVVERMLTILPFIASVVPDSPGTVSGIARLCCLSSFTPSMTKPPAVLEKAATTSPRSRGILLVVVDGQPFLRTLFRRRISESQEVKHHRI